MTKQKPTPEELAAIGERMIIDHIFRAALQLQARTIVEVPELTLIIAFSAALRDCQEKKATAEEKKE